jgi:two-component system, NarL family, response regulator DevR
VANPNGSRQARRTRIFLVDGFELLHVALQRVVSSEKGFTWAGAAASAGEALEAIAESSPDLVLLGVRLPDGSGIELCTDILIRYPHLNCLMFSSYGDEQTVLASIQAGASGFWLKDGSVADLVEAIRHVAEGRAILHPKLTERVLGRLRAEYGQGALQKLSRRETEVLELVAKGLPNARIAASLRITEQTVKNHVSSILGKLGVENRTQAALQLRLNKLHLPNS